MENDDDVFVVDATCHRIDDDHCCRHHVIHNGVDLGLRTAFLIMVDHGIRGQALPQHLPCVGPIDADVFFAMHGVKRGE